MQLIIVRHGEAVPAEETQGGTDEERALTAKGIRKTREVAKGLRALACKPDRILSSPLVRAAQTADILAKALGPKAARETTPQLAPGTAPGEVIERLRALEDETVMLVGHMPDLAELTSVLLCGRPSADIRFKKSGACALFFRDEMGPGEGCLEWLMQPQQLGALARVKKGMEGDGSD